MKILFVEDELSKNMPRIISLFSGGAFEKMGHLDICHSLNRR